MLLVAALIAVLGGAAAVTLRAPAGSGPVPAGSVAEAPPLLGDTSGPAPTSPEPAARPNGARVIGVGDESIAGPGSWYARLALADPKLSSLGAVSRPRATTADLLSRFTDQVLAPHPQLVIVMAGGSDLAAKVGRPTIVANLAEMVDLVQATGARVVLCTLPPRGSATPVTDLNANIRDLARRTDAMLLELHDPVSTRDGAWVEADSDDGATPNDTGQAALAQAARNQLARAGL